ncbi:MAG TPA: cation diffusion facilitator family transporter [Bryobacteraceae bacterium]|nr:cation diffusion facilitator family transporter [Bryobacteraceae bacterium]
MHHHSHGTGKALTWSTAATLAFVAIEAAAGLWSHSLALLSDAGHNFTDALALILAAVALRYQAKPPDETKTYGYQRAGVLAALFNAVTLVVIALVIFWEAWQRLVAPEPVHDTVMLVVSTLGVVVNGAIMLSLHRGRKDLNIRAAYIHMLGDAIGAIGIIAGALLIRFTGWVEVDPILSILIGVMIVWTAWDIIRESLNVLLEGLPRGMNLQAITAELRAVAGVVDVHDLHIWSLGSEANALSCHVLIEDMPPSASNGILKRINDVLCGFGIHHTTIQFEHVRCALSASPCMIHPASHSHG